MQLTSLKPAEFNKSHMLNLILIYQP